MDVSSKIKKSLDKYSKLAQEVSEMKEALSKFDFVAFGAAHDRMQDCLESFEFSLEDSEEEPISEIS